MQGYPRLSLVEGLLEYLEFPFLKFNYFQYSRYLFPKVFLCQISWNSNDGSREIGVFPRVQFSFNSKFFDLLRMRCI